MNAILRLNLTSPSLDPADLTVRYRAALDMATAVDDAGFVAITVDEHHGAPDGWMPSPLVFAGMLAARTTQVFISIQALLLPLHDPLRVAEDLIVADHVSGGRLAVTLGLGYRPEEYVAHEKDWDRRGAIMDDAVATLLHAWRGEAIRRGDREVRVTPPPLTSNPPFMIGGSSKVSARRAARFGLPWAPSAHLPDIEAYYHEQCAANGTTAVVVSPPGHVALVFVAEDPDEAWATVGQHLLHEATLYASWQTADIRSAVRSTARSADELREEGIYQILSPDQIRAAIAEDPHASFVLHPLCGGMPVDRAWECVRLFIDTACRPRDTASDPA